ncbi:hypothetical protein [Ensifer aridi]
MEKEAAALGAAISFPQAEHRKRARSRRELKSKQSDIEMNY